MLRVERYWQKVDKNGPLLVPSLGQCWDWLGGLHKDGYGNFWNGTKKDLAHRYSFETFVRPLEPEEKVLHKCDNPPCTNYGHLFGGTQLENIIDCMSKGRRKGRVLSFEEVQEIKARYSGYGDYVNLSREYGVSKQTVRRIILGGRE